MQLNKTVKTNSTKSNRKTEIIEKEVAEVIKEKKITTTAPIYKIQKSKQLKVFDFMKSKDQDSLHKLLQDLDSLMVLLGSGELNHSEILQIKDYLINISDIASIYDESANMSDSLYKLSMTIDNNIETFEKEARNIAKLCQSFSSDLLTWYRKLFIEGHEHYNFMDSSIEADTQTIIQFLEPEENSENIDDIFDF